MKVTVNIGLEGTTYRKKWLDERKEFGLYCFLCGIVIALMVAVALI